VFEKLEGVLVLFKKTSRKVNVICHVIINVGFIINFFSSYFLNSYCIAMRFDAYPPLQIPKQTFKNKKKSFFCKKI